MYSEQQRRHYAELLVWDNNSRGDVEPHVYETSSLSYRGLAADGQHQSILVSGESGAGKTETVKILMNHLASVQAGCCSDVVVTEEKETTKRNLEKTSFQLSSPIVQRVLDSNPLLEAFGNAKTVRNDNSSRFGKYLQLQFDAEDPTHAAYAGKALPSCVLAGSKCEVYLLEKSRVITHEQDEERTFHIFYQILAAPEEEKKEIWDVLEDCDQESFAYVGYTDVDTIEGKTDGERFALTKTALAEVGVVDDTFLTLMRAICIVLQLGNLTFGPLDDGEHSEILSTDELSCLCQLMGVEEETVTLAFTERTMTARNETFKVPLTEEKASDARDALAKEIYAKTFLWLVRTVNDATCAERNYDGSRKSGFGVIGLLDIFGFESFQTNRFEQLCINYANEKLQQKFTQDIFRSVQVEYEEEGIELGEISYEDNADVLQLVEGRMGMIAVLNEECVRPKGSDTAFVSKIQAMNKDSDVLILEKAFRNYEFGVLHYAGRVVYDANKFVTKNMDTLPQDLLACAKKSSNVIVANELENEAMMNDGKPKKKAKKKAPSRGAKPSGGGRGGGGLVQQTVFSKFRNQLTSLMTQLGDTRTRYIRCIKPNTTKQPKLMMHESTIEQLRCAGVVAAVTISRSAFPNRLDHELVLDRFKPLWPKGTAPSTEKDHSEAQKTDCGTLLTDALKSLETRKDDGSLVKAFVIGNTRAYFRAGALEFLEAERLKGLGKWATLVQRVVRGFVQRSKYVRMRDAAINAVATMRRYVQRRKYLRLRAACVVLQCWSRCQSSARLLVAKRRTYRAAVIQSRWRMAVAMVYLRENKQAARSIQAIVRGFIQRPRFRDALKQKREDAKLVNQLEALQRKLEEAERARVEAEKKAAEAKKEPEVRVIYKEKEPEVKETKQEDDNKADDSVEQAEGDEEASAATSAAKETPSPVAQVQIPLQIQPKEPSSEPTGTLTSQQQTLMDESGKMLEYLRKEVFKLRSQNAQLRTDFDLLKENNQRLMDANASAGASFAALNQHAKQLNKANAKITAELGHYKGQVQTMGLQHVEIKEELKMKQATYIAEVHSRLQYQKAMASIVDIIQDRCRDHRLVEDVLDMYDECEADYMDGPAAGATSRQNLNGPMTPDNDASNASMMSTFRNFFT